MTASMQSQRGRAPNVVHHYTRLSTAIEKILPQMSLRIGRYSATNDPRETQHPDFIFSQQGDAFDDEFWTSVHEHDDHLGKIHARLRVMCCSQSEPGAKHPEQHGYGLSRMWAQYGDAHAGVCFVLDAERLDAAIRSVVRTPNALWSGSVEYKPLSVRNSVQAFCVEMVQPSELDDLFVRHYAQHHRELMFEKATDWRDEREYRWVYLAEENEPDVFVPIGDCVRELIIGYSCHKAYIAALRSACPKGSTIKMRQMIWRFGQWAEPAVIT